MRRVLLTALCISFVTLLYTILDKDKNWLDYLVQKNAHSSVIYTNARHLNKTQNIILNALPKSGSEYLVRTLENSLGYQRMKISSEYILTDQIHIDSIRKFYEQGGRISKQHLDASNLNIRVLKMFTNKIVLNFRDPRDVLLSWVHNLNSLRQQGIDYVCYFDAELPPHYYELSLSEQIDWNIENFLPNVVSWMNKWLVLNEQESLSKNGLKILITTHDELIEDELKLYTKILNFYEIPLGDFTFKPAEKSLKTHFRRGIKGEWRTVFTEKQKKRVSEIVPESLLQKFNWS